jgi:hypothetical protein
VILAEEDLGTVLTYLKLARHPSVSNLGLAGYLLGLLIQGFRAGISNGSRAPVFDGSFAVWSQSHYRER